MTKSTRKPAATTRPATPAPPVRTERRYPTDAAGRDAAVRARVVEYLTSRITDARETLAKWGAEAATVTAGYAEIPATQPTYAAVSSFIEWNSENAAAAEGRIEVIGRVLWVDPTLPADAAPTGAEILAEIDAAIERYTEQLVKYSQWMPNSTGMFHNAVQVWKCRGYAAGIESLKTARELAGYVRDDIARDDELFGVPAAPAPEPEPLDYPAPGAAAPTATPEPAPAAGGR